GGAGVAAAVVVGGNEVERRAALDGGLAPQPGVRAGDGILAGGALEGARQHGEGIALLAVPRPAGDLAVAQARRERGVRVDGGAVDLEARLGDALLVLVEGRGELLLHRLAQLLAEGTELAGEDDGRIPGGLNGLQ